MDKREFRIIGVALLVIAALFILFAVSASAQEVRRATGRVSPTPYDEECQYVAAPWGTPIFVDL